MAPPRRTRRGGSSQSSSRTQSEARTTSLDRVSNSSRASSSSRRSRRDTLEEQDVTELAIDVNVVAPVDIVEGDLISLHDDDPNDTVQPRLHEPAVLDAEPGVSNDALDQAQDLGTGDDIVVNTVADTVADAPRVPSPVWTNGARLNIRGQPFHDTSVPIRNRIRNAVSASHVIGQGSDEVRFDQFGLPSVPQETAGFRNVIRPRETSRPELDEFGLPVTGTTLRRNDYRLNQDLTDDDDEIARLQDRFDRLTSRKPAQNSSRHRQTGFATSSKTTMGGDTTGTIKKLTDEDTDMRRKIDCLLLECDDFCDAATGQKLTGRAKDEGWQLVKRITDATSSLMGKTMVEDQNRMTDLRKFRSALKKKLINSDNAEAAAPLPNSPQNSFNSNNSTSSNGLLSTLAKHRISVELA